MLSLSLRAKRSNLPQAMARCRRQIASSRCRAPRNDAFGRENRSVGFVPLVGFGQAQDPLGDVAEGELWAHRGDARDLRFAQITLDMIFLGIAEAAMGQHRGLAGAPARLGG